MNQYGEFIVEYELEAELSRRVVTKRVGVGQDWNEARATLCAGELESTADMCGLKVGRITIMHFDPERMEYRKW